MKFSNWNTVIIFHCTIQVYQIASSVFFTVDVLRDALSDFVVNEFCKTSMLLPRKVCPLSCHQSQCGNNFNESATLLCKYFPMTHKNNFTLNYFVHLQQHYVSNHDIILKFFHLEVLELVPWDTWENSGPVMFISESIISSRETLITIRRRIHWRVVVWGECI